MACEGRLPETAAVSSQFEGLRKLFLNNVIAIAHRLAPSPIRALFRAKAGDGFHEDEEDYEAPEGPQQEAGDEGSREGSQAAEDGRGEQQQILGQEAEPDSRREEGQPAPRRQQRFPLTGDHSANGIGVPLAATGLLYPVWAMVAMAASVTTIFLNSLWGRPQLFIDAILSVGRPVAETIERAA